MLCRKKIMRVLLVVEDQYQQYHWQDTVGTYQQHVHLAVIDSNYHNSWPTFN